MYGSIRSYWRPHERTPASLLLHHDRSYRKFLEDYEEVARKDVSHAVEIPTNIKDRLFTLIADTRSLRSAWDTLSQDGGQAPGPNGDTYSDFSTQEVWELLRATSRHIKAGTYRRGPEKKVSIPKSSGRGTRTLRLTNIEDRVVDRAILQIIQPLFDPLFDERSFGFRPRLDRQHALAAAQQLTIQQGQTVWIVDDIKDCFDQIPRSRLYDVLARRLPENVVQLIRLVTDAKQKRGLRQGSPLSPFLVNVYLDHFLDQPWRKSHPDGAPLLRTADDILVLARPGDNTEVLYRKLADRLRSAGVPLKGTYESACQQLDAGGKATWLGYCVCVQGDNLAVEVTQRSWDNLAHALEQAHEKPLAARGAGATILGWLAQMAPCQSTTTLEALTSKMFAIAKDKGFEELPSRFRINEQWERAVGRWRQIQSPERTPPDEDDEVAYDESLCERDDNSVPF